MVATNNPPRQHFFHRKSINWTNCMKTASCFQINDISFVVYQWTIIIPVKLVIIPPVRKVIKLKVTDRPFKEWNSYNLSTVAIYKLAELGLILKCFFWLQNYIWTAGESLSCHVEASDKARHVGVMWPPCDVMWRPRDVTWCHVMSCGLVILSHWQWHGIEIFPWQTWRIRVSKRGYRADYFITYVLVGTFTVSTANHIDKNPIDQLGSVLFSLFNLFKAVATAQLHLHISDDIAIS